MNSEDSNILFGYDPEEKKREDNKKHKPANIQIADLQQQGQSKKKDRKLMRKQNKLQQLSPEESITLSNQKDIPIEKQHPSHFKLISILNSENQMGLEEYVKQQYSNGNNKVDYMVYPPESDFGNTEYKLRLVNPDLDKLTHLTTQMNYRLQEGHGIAYYKIGVEDSGNPHGLKYEDMLNSLWTVCQMAQSLKAEIMIVGLSQGYFGKIAEIMVRQAQKEGIKLDIRILLLGASGSGKTSLLGVLVSGQYDNGEVIIIIYDEQGLARMKILKNKSEILSGKTERVSHTVIGYDMEGKIINHEQSQFSGMNNVEKIVDLSTKLITFIDMGGNKRAHTQMIQIINSQFPDYAILVISALQELNKFTEDYFKLLSVQQLPLIIVVTHVDVAPEIQIDNAIDQIKEIVANIEDKVHPAYLTNSESQSSCGTSMNFVPFQINYRKRQPCLSSYYLMYYHYKFIQQVQGQSLSSFINFLNLLPSTNQLINNQLLPSEVSIHNTFENNIIAGTVIKGVIKKHQILQIGPDKEAKFYPTEVEEIKCNRVKVNSVQCGQICTIKLKWSNLSKKFFENGNAIRNGIIGNQNNQIGMVLVDGTRIFPRAYWEFDAEIWLFECEKSAKNISPSYEPVINFQTSRQICKIIKDFKESLVKLTLAKQKSKSIDNKV